MAIEDDLKSTLIEVLRNIPVNEFCGVGVVVHMKAANLPVAPMCPKIALPETESIINDIVLCSLASNECHDGFQLVSEELVLTKRNQFFAPYVEGHPLSSKCPVGARYMAAMYGSLLKNVLCTGLVSERNGVLVFVKGEIK